MSPKDEPVTSGPVAFLVLLMVIAVLSPMTVLVAWNWGVSGIVSSAGGYVSDIGYLTAFGVGFVLLLARGSAFKVGE